jgi:hypothetical protein
MADDKEQSRESKRQQHDRHKVTYYTEHAYIDSRGKAESYTRETRAEGMHAI